MSQPNETIPNISGFCPYGCGSNSFPNAWGVHANAICSGCHRLFIVGFGAVSNRMQARALTDAEAAAERAALGAVQPGKPPIIT
jgi:hypothetical protein